MKHWYKLSQAGKVIIYIDESGFEAYAVRQYGWAAMGEKVYGERHGNRRPRTSFLAARMPDGTLAATQLWEGTCNTVIFNDWVRDLLCPLLNGISVVVMDNAAFHKSEETRRLIESTGAILLFLPPYSPDLNPIEQDFATLKKIREYNHEQSIDDIIKSYS